MGLLEKVDAPDPVFVVGTPRTGVRLLATVLDGHPELAGGPQLPIVLTIARQWQDLARTLGVNHEQHHRLPPNEVRDLYRTGILRLLMPRVRAAGKRRFICHSFGAVVALDAFASLFPAARFVLLVRDPRSVAASLLRCNWRSPQDGQPLPYTRDPGAAAQFWSQFTTHGLNGAVPLIREGRLLQLKYEDLCADPAAQMRRLGSFLGIERVIARLGATSPDEGTPSSSEIYPPLRVGALDQASLSRWHDVLDPDSVRLIESLTQTLRKRLGYV